MASPRDIAREEVLSLIGSHIATCESREPRFGPESKEFTEMKRRELAIILYDLEEEFGYIHSKEEPK